MYSKSLNYNELSKNEYSVWANLNSEIDPAQWAKLCRQIGNLSPTEFTTVVALVNAHKSLKNALAGHIKGILGIGEDGQVGSRRSSQEVRQGMPILSVGPSGLGGEYQVYEQISNSKYFFNESENQIFSNIAPNTIPS